MTKMKAVSVAVPWVVAGSAWAGATVRDEPIRPIEPAKVADPAKVELGKKLWFEPRLSMSGIISCNTCHNLSMGGTDNLKISIGHGWKAGSVNSPTVFNSSLAIAQFRDGRAAGGTSFQRMGVVEPYRDPRPPKAAPRSPGSTPTASTSRCRSCRPRATRRRAPIRSGKHCRGGRSTPGAAARRHPVLVRMAY